MIDGLTWSASIWLSRNECSWEKGQTFKYNDAVSRLYSSKDAGWDDTRTRAGGKSSILFRAAVVVTSGGCGY
jgi:hypothetical protein